MSKRFVLWSAGIGVYSVVAYAAYQIQTIRKKRPPPPQIQDPDYQRSLVGDVDVFPVKPLQTVYQKIASSYDESIDHDEWWMGLSSKRKQLLNNAKGAVLEVASGTGRNLHLYPKPPTISSISLIDHSSNMLDIAWQKYLDLTRKETYFKTLPKSTFHRMDASKLAFQDACFDTVVDTFGLCSCEDPKLMIQEMERVCKPNGVLLFLEHGRSNANMFQFVNDFMNELLDKGAMDHANRWGCWWNRDIEHLIESAGLEIIERKRYHLGTTYSIVAKKRE